MVFPMIKAYFSGFGVVLTPCKTGVVDACKTGRKENRTRIVPAAAGVEPVATKTDNVESMLALEDSKP